MGAWVAPPGLAPAASAPLEDIPGLGDARSSHSPQLREKCLVRRESSGKVQSGTWD